MTSYKATPKDTLIVLIDSHITIRDSKVNVWESGGFFSRIKDLETDLRGEIGEKFIAETLRELGHKTVLSNKTDPTEKHWDVLVDDKVKLEVKTATVGADGRMFQHENIEKDRNYHAVVLVDIAPNDIYLTVAPKNTLPFVEKNSVWSINLKHMHRRRKGSDYKWDLSLKDVESRRIDALEDIKKQFEPLFKELL